MNGEAESSPRIVIDFTDEEWDIICEAAKAHKETFLEFVNTAIQNAAKEKEAARKKFTPVKTFTAPPWKPRDKSSATLPPATWRMETPSRRTSGYTVNWKRRIPAARERPLYGTFHSGRLRSHHEKYTIPPSPNPEPLFNTMMNAA